MPHMGKTLRAARTAAIIALFTSGKTLQEIGVVYGVSRERVRQILATKGLNGTDGGQRVRKVRQAAERLLRRDARYHEKYGCSFDEYQALKGKPTLRFITQRKTAAHRGIDWQLKFAEWWKVWQDSGKWAERGRGHGRYVMSRIGDTGPYALGNVFIQLADANNSVTPRKKNGLPTGVRQNGSNYCAMKMLGGKTRYLGSYATPQEALAAYQLECYQPNAMTRRNRVASVHSPLPIELS